ncbi:MAG: hypothetical protein N2517_06735 [Ignavibacteria bacterium]|nr:hypothetical protein [Ignavibacteria bacterium]
MLYSLSMLMLFFLSSWALALTQKPNQKPCISHCCQILPGGFLRYFCFPATAICTIECQIECKDPEENQAYVTYHCGIVQVEADLCRRFSDIHSTSGCDFDETEIVTVEITNQSTGICQTKCAEYSNFSCRGIFAIVFCKFKLK